jgi:thiamine transport system permease protein
LAAPAAVGLALFFLWPVGTLLARVLEPGSLTRTLRAAGIGGVLWFTLWQAVVSTVLTLCAGLAPAYVLARYRFPGRRMVLALVTVPFMLPTVVVGAAFLALLPSSWHHSAQAVLVAHVYFNIAVVVRLVAPLWAAIPFDLTAAARTLGAHPRQVLRHVLLPLLFLFTFTSYGVVRLLGGVGTTTIEVEVARRATQLGDVDGAAVLSVMQLLVLAVVVLVASSRQRRSAVALAGAEFTRRPRGRRQRLVVAAVAALTAAVMAVPLVTMVVRSLRLDGRWTLVAWRTLGRSEIRPGVSLGVDPLASLFVSLRFALVAMVLSATVGALAALAIALARRHGRLLDVGLMLPLATSAVTVGLGVLITFDSSPVDWRAEWWLIPVGHALVATPFVVRALLPALRSIPAARRDAAATLGAAPWRAWWEVDVRSIARPFVGAAGLAAAVSLGEFGATTFLTRAGRETLPIAIARLLARAGEVPRAQAFALATMLMAVTALIVALVERPLSGGVGDARSA